MSDMATLAPLDESLASLFAEEALQNVVSDHARVAVLRGLEHALLLAPAVAASTGAAVGAGAAGFGAGSAAVASGFTAKAVAGIAVVAFGAGGLSAQAVQHARAPEPALQMQSAPIAAPAPGPLALDASLAVDAAPSLTLKPAATPAPSSALSTLSAERELLDVGRAALARGRGEDALAAAKNHAKQFQNGQLAEEREVLAIQALRVSGKRAEATERAAHFAKRYPESIYTGALEEP